MSSEAATHPQPSPPSRIAGLVAWPRRLPGTLALGLIGSALLWLAQPPACLSLLAWLAPMPWLLVALGEDPLGRRGWLKLWAAGAAYWAAAVWWVVLPHPLTPLGLPFLAGYLGMYLPAFVWLVRAALRHTPLPLWVAAPAAWVGLEWLQSHLFTGFAIAGLAHTQAWWPSVIQIASFGGAYAVSFVMLMFAAGVVDGARAVQRSRDRSLIQFDPRPPVAFFAATVPVAVTLFTGHFRATSGGIEIAPSVGTATVALLQSDIRATWDPDPKRSERIMQRMLDLSKQAARQAEAAGKTLDLIVWPESMFRTPVWTFADQFTPPPELNPAYAERAGYAQRNAQAFAIWTGTPTLFGIDRYNYPGPFIGDVMEWEMTFHNSAALADAQGNFVAVYDKMHRVPFGEYIPLFENLPALYYLTPLSGGITPGERPVAMEARGARREARTPEEGLASEDSRLAPRASRLTICPNICYETVIPHVIRRHVKQLRDDGTPPDLLVNVTNNAWFWGSSELEMHLACNIFRSVENGTPMVIAANGGLSGAIDSRGRVLAVSDRMQDEVVLAEVPLDASPTVYTRRGDVVALPCLIVCVGLTIISVSKKVSSAYKQGPIDETLPS